MDETLCDTTGANQQALEVLSAKISDQYPAINSQKVAQQYLEGIYRKLNNEYQILLNPIKDEGEFRVALIKKILADFGCSQINNEQAQILQNTFDQARTQHFDFFPGIKDWLIDIRKQFTLVLITNGPEFSQVLKVKTVQMEKYVDYIIIGGQEKEEKPAASIFEKALRLASCNAQEAIHIGDSFNADILGAHKAGITSVWIQHNQTLPPQQTINPDFILQSPLELSEFFSRQFSTSNL